MATVGDVWMQWFSCCFYTPQSSHRPIRRHHQRLKIDRTMIGNPSNFVHLGHIGSADVEQSSNHLDSLQTQMQSKGGYVDTNSVRMPGNYDRIKVRYLVYLFPIQFFNYITHVSLIEYEFIRSFTSSGEK